MKEKKIFLGEGHVIDEGVILGYSPSRDISNETLVIGQNAHIRSGSVIYAGSHIGEGLQTGHNVVIREENYIGDNFWVWSNSVVDYACRIGNNVRVHCNVYIAQYTVIEDDVFLAPGVTIANDLHPICQKCMAGPHIKRGVKVGINATILPRLLIGEDSVIGAGSVVTKDVPPRSLVIGNPGRVIKRVEEIKCHTGMIEKPYPE